MLTPEKLIKTIAEDIIKYPLSSEKNFELGGTKNTFRKCIERNNGIGDKVSIMLHNLIAKHPEKRNEILQYLEQFLTLEEKRIQKI